MSLHKNMYTSTDMLNAEFASKIVEILRKGIEVDGKASLVVSGGRTPLPLFAALSKQDIQWDKVDITLADERWVSQDNSASNEKLVRENLLVNNAAAATFVGLKTEHSNAEDATTTVSQRLSTMKRPFDVLILGMGEDGHTASLFPCSEQLLEGLDLDSDALCLAVTPTTAPNQRMSLSLKALLNSKHVFLHLTGDSKKRVLEQAESGSDEKQMPIRAILANTDVSLMWAP